jgi:hypothetical protein
MDNESFNKKNNYLKAVTEDLKYRLSCNNCIWVNKYLKCMHPERDLLYPVKGDYICKLYEGWQI